MRKLGSRSTSLIVVGFTSLSSCTSFDPEDLGAADEVAVDQRELSLVESCNGIDDDGDGSIDEDFVRVPEAYATIQSGVDAVAPGGSVCVGQGTFVTNVEMPAKSLTLVSTNGSSYTTLTSATIRGTGVDSVIEFLDGSAVYDVTISGFTISGGSSAEQNSGPQNDCAADHDDECNDGGGINATPAASRGLGTLTLRDIVLRDNVSQDDGGAIYANGVDLVLDSVTLIDNTARDTGGGLRLVSGTLTMTNSLVTGNAATSTGSFGGGGLALVSSSASIISTSITGNVTSASGGGIAAANPGAGAREIALEDSDISNNYGSTGGGAYLSGTVALACAGDTSSDRLGFLENEAVVGGGIYLSTNATFEATSCDVDANTPSAVAILSGATYDTLGTDVTTTCSYATHSCDL